MWELLNAEPPVFMVTSDNILRSSCQKEKSRVFFARILIREVNGTSDSKLKNQLIKDFEAEVRTLSRMLGRDLSRWSILTEKDYVSAR